MPGGIRTDDDFWRLLSQREIVREPVTDRYGRATSPSAASQVRAVSAALTKG